MKKIYKEAIWQFVSGTPDNPKTHWELHKYLIRCYRCKYAKSMDQGYQCKFNDKYLVKSHDYCSKGKWKED